MYSYRPEAWEIYKKNTISVTHFRVIDKTLKVIFFLREAPDEMVVGSKKEPRKVRLEEERGSFLLFPSLCS